METEKGNFIKINRSILEWRWFKNGNTLRLFLYLLLKANWKDSYFEEYEIKRGSFVTSIGIMANETGLTVQQTRTALEHLQKTGEITIKSTNKFTIVTIEKYNVFQGMQGNEQQTNQQSNNIPVTNEQQSNNKQVTTIEEEKEYKEEKDREEEEENSCPLSPDDSIWKEIILLYPRRKGQETECKEKYFELLNKQENRQEFIEDTKAAISDYLEKYEQKSPDDAGEYQYIIGFKRFFDEELQKAIQSYRNTKAIFKGWSENGKILPIFELREESGKGDFEHRGETEYTEVLRELYRAYPIHNFVMDAYESLFFGIVNKYEDGTGANLLYAAVGKYLDGMKHGKQYSIPDLGYWLKHEATGVMKNIENYKKLIHEKEGNK